jgi:hypothetical protein
MTRDRADAWMSDVGAKAAGVWASGGDGRLKSRVAQYSRMVQVAVRAGVVLWRGEENIRAVLAKWIREPAKRTVGSWREGTQVVEEINMVVMLTRSFSVTPNRIPRKHIRDALNAETCSAIRQFPNLYERALRVLHALPVSLISAS